MSTRINESGLRMGNPRPYYVTSRRTHLVIVSCRAPHSGCVLALLPVSGVPPPVCTALTLTTATHRTSLYRMNCSWPSLKRCTHNLTQRCADSCAGAVSGVQPRRRRLRHSGQPGSRRGKCTLAGERWPMRSSRGRSAAVPYRLVTEEGGGWRNATVTAIVTPLSTRTRHKLTRTNFRADIYAIFPNDITPALQFNFQQ